MKNEFQPFLDRLTHRLRFDPELRLEIQRELRGHLNDKLKEHRALGLDDGQAHAAAARAIGDESEVEQQLWRANRSRMTRRAICRWLAMTLLAPAACLVCVYVALAVIRSASPAIVLTNLNYQSDPPPILQLATWQTDRLFGPLPPGERMLLSPDTRKRWTGNYDPADFAKRLESAKSLSEAHPNDAAFLIDYALLAAGDQLVGSAADDAPPVTASDLREALAICDRGEKLDPENAYFPMLAAQILARASSRQLRNQPDDYYPYSVVYPNGKIHTSNSWKLQVDDPALFSQALMKFRDAAAKPKLEDYSAVVRQQRLSLLPAADDFGKLILRIDTSLYSRPERLWEWELLFTFSARAVDLAAAGDRAQTLQLETDINRVAALTAFGGEDPTVTIFSSGFYADTIAGHAAAVLQLTGHDDQARDLRSWMIDFTRQRGSVFHGDIKNTDPRSTVANVYAPFMYGVPVDVAPLNHAEYSLADRAALVGLIATLLAVVLIAAVGAVFESLIARRSAAPALVILPRPRELGWLLLAAALPILIYAIWVTTAPIGSRSTGPGIRQIPLVMEYLIVIVAVAAFGLFSAARIIRRHLAAVGGVTTTFGSLGPAAMVLLPALAVVAAGAAWAFSFSLADQVMTGAIILLSVALLIAFRMGRASPLYDAAANLCVIGSVVLPVLAVIAVAGALAFPFGLANEVMIGATILLAAVLLLALRVRHTTTPSDSALNLRITGSMLRSLAVTAALLAFVISLLGGLGLRYVEASAVRRIQADPVLSQVNVELDPQVVALRQELVERSRLMADQFAADDQSKN